MISDFRLNVDSFIKMENELNEKTRRIEDAIKKMEYTEVEQLLQTSSIEETAAKVNQLILMFNEEYPNINQFI